MSTRPFIRALVLVCLAASTSVGAQGPARLSLPTRISDAEFWKLMTDMSEVGGNFDSDNFTSNEMGYPGVISTLRASNVFGGAYVGVGPEQNFSYIAGIRPQIAFIVDIRHQAVMQHLMYKAIFELSKDRADFVSLLFSKPRPAGLDSATSIAAIWDAFWYVRTDTAVYPKNLARIKDQLTRTHGFALDTTDLAALPRVYEAFYRLGPVISYFGHAPRVRIEVASSGDRSFRMTQLYAPTFTIPTGSGSVASTGVVMSTSGLTDNSHYDGVTFAALSASADGTGKSASFLATEANYRFVRDLSNNLVIPLVGDFAGPKAIRGVGAYLRDHGATVTAFYTSNVEDYLFQNDVWARFYQNVGTLPLTFSSVFLRGGAWVCPISPFLSAVAAGRVQRYADATACVR